MKRIKKYYRIVFELTSPLSVGSGENNVTDRDILRDGRGVPYIPGTALAGVYRSLFSEGTAEEYFGPELTEEKIRDPSLKGKNILKDSEVVTYDAYIIEPGESRVTKRDMVALDEYKAAVKGAKFDFQILEPGVTFVTYIEQNMDNKDQQYVLDEIAAAWMKGKITAGAKTGRGYGHTKGITAASAMFDLTEEDQLEKWLQFEMYDPNDPNWTAVGNTDGNTVGIANGNPDGSPLCLGDFTPGDGKYAEVKAAYARWKIKLAEEEKCRITLELRQQGGISVRQYTTEVNEPDYMQLTARRIPGEARKAAEDSASDERIADEGTPVIPGTSWAGAFRAQMGRLDADFRKGHPAAELFFGKAKNKSRDSRKTRTGFSESRITGGKWVVNTRNAIDRFTGGAVDKALYTEKTYYNGTTTLEITCDFGGEAPVSAEDRKRFVRVLAAAVLDLHSGYMAVGGLTAVGRGMFRVEKITVDGKEYATAGKKPEEIYGGLVKALGGEEDR